MSIYISLYVYIYIYISNLHDGSERVEDRLRGEVLRRDEDQRRLLTPLLVLDNVEELRVLKIATAPNKNSILRICIVYRTSKR